jgi:ribosomal protein L11 methyltransferase
MALLELRVELAPRAAELLSEALLELGAHSVDMGTPESESVVLSAIFPESADPARALRLALETCGQQAAPVFTVRAFADEDWVRRSQSQFLPVRIGRIWVGASWHEPADAPVKLRIDPGLAFGTGSHATTRLMLGFLDRTIEGGERVLDYGCGSGILAIAAAKLGARHVDAVDIDPAAIAVTHENARANGAPVRACLPEALPPGRYDVLVANILARPLIELAPALAGHARAGAAVALAGVLAPQSTDVLAAYAQDFALAVAEQEEGWTLLCGVRR